VGGELEVIKDAPLPLFIFFMVLGIALLTEFASNTAAAAMALPILGATAGVLGVSPVVLCIPAAAAASCAFMLPAATPPNAILFGTGSFTIPQMLRAGIWIDLIATLFVTLAAVTLIPALFGG